RRTALTRRTWVGCPITQACQGGGSDATPNWRSATNQNDRAGGTDDKAAARPSCSTASGIESGSKDGARAPRTVATITTFSVVKPRAQSVTEPRRRRSSASVWWLGSRASDGVERVGRGLVVVHRLTN